jgi:hypothetical protein
MIKKIIYITLIFCGLIQLILTGDIYASGNVGTSGATFLELGTGSRPLALGEAFTASSGDINAIYYNPAGLGTMAYPVLSVMHEELIVDSRFENVSLAYPLYSGFLGLSNSVFWVPQFDKIDMEGEKDGTVQFYNTSGTAAYGRSFGFMEAGASVKYIYQKIYNLNIHSAAVDLGILKRMYMFSPFDAPIRNFSIGLSLQNFGTKSKDDQLPRLLRMGTSYYLLDWLGINVDLTESARNTSDLYDFTSGFNESFRINTGIEATYLNLLALRAGYRFNDAGTYSFGVGFNYAVQNVAFTIDTSYSDAGVFGPVYSITLSFKLIPKIITKEDERRAEDYYQKGVRNYIADDIDSAIDAFEQCFDYDPYHRSVKKKIEDLKDLKRLQRQEEEMEKEAEKYK